MSKNLISDGLYFPDWDEVQWPVQIPNSDGNIPGKNETDYLKLIEKMLKLLGEINTIVEYQSGIVCNDSGIADVYFSGAYTTPPAYTVIREFYQADPLSLTASEYIMSDTGLYIGVRIYSFDSTWIFSLVAYIHY